MTTYHVKSQNTRITYDHVTSHKQNRETKRNCSLDWKLRDITAAPTQVTKSLVKLINTTKIMQLRAIARHMSHVLATKQLTTASYINKVKLSWYR